MITDIVGLKQAQIWWNQHGKVILHFAVMVAGVLSREFYEQMRRGASCSLNVADLTLALIGAVLIFPALQAMLEQVGLKSPWLRSLAAFQCGFCWRVKLGIKAI